VSDSIGDKLRRNTQAGMLTWLWGQMLMMTRMMVYYRFLSEGEYGLWFLAFQIMGYFVFYNMGINTAFIKYTAEYHARNEHDELSHLLSTGLAFALLMGASIVVFLFLFTDFMVALFDFSPKNVADAQYVVQGIGLVTAFSIGFGVYSAVLIGIQRLDLLNLCRAAFLTIEVLLGFVFLYLGLGVRTLVFVYGVSVIGGTLSMAWMVKRQVPVLKLNPLLARRRCLPVLFSLGVKMQVLGAVAMIAATIDGIMYAKFGAGTYSAIEKATDSGALLAGDALTFVGIYAIARTVANRAQGAALQCFGALAPASADLFARGDRSRISAVYGTALQICGLGSAYLFAFIAVNSDFTMLFFQGEKYNPLSAWALTFLSVALAIHTLSGPGSSMLRGAGLVWREMLYQALTLLLFVLFFFAAHEHGFESRVVVMSYPLALSLASLLFIGLANRFFGVPMCTPFCRLALLIAVAPLLAYLLRIGWLALPMAHSTGRWWALGELVILGIPYTLFFALASWYLPGLSEADKEQILKFIPGARRMAAWLP